ncbi:urease accessory protein UreF [Salinisphaera orenii MK-B5]|uniref:Urease accessory protein UreF n=1 Tax=Salinisphaera orenii MK-B5 TaxID=856730 RepID=A0A423PF44_9GAMM|nr:urease accessory UreF family protein [Salinisphaera orenii]ROO24190.1 urease accessory protein UreF [Salinisphaera orenii MK-B5]
MRAVASRLLMLQQADSFFPGGAVAWSWGLETLVAEAVIPTASRRSRQRARGAVGAGDDASDALRQFIVGQLTHRWACCDRAFLAAAWHVDGVLDDWISLDFELEAITLAAELRQGSRRLGASLLGVHAELGTAHAADYQRRVDTEEAPGHVAVLQGMLWRALGIDHEDALLASAHMLSTGLVSAALRLGVVGHLAGQLILAELQPVIRALLVTPVPDVSRASAFTPLAEMAVMRHETLSPRLFAN